MKTNTITLNPDETGTVSNLWVSTAGKDLSQYIYITCYADASNIISEQKENNNSLTLIKHW
jgi:CARDB